MQRRTGVFRNEKEYPTAVRHHPGLLHDVFISCRPHKDILPTVQRIQERGVLLVGTTGDYRPLTFREADSTYWGFEIDMAEEMARRLGVGFQFVPTSWPTLTADVLADPQAGGAIDGYTLHPQRNRCADAQGTGY